MVQFVYRESSLTGVVLCCVVYVSFVMLLNVLYTRCAIHTKQIIMLYNSTDKLSMLFNSINRTGVLSMLNSQVCINSQKENKNAMPGGSWSVDMNVAFNSFF